MALSASLSVRFNKLQFLNLKPKSMKKKWLYHSHKIMFYEILKKMKLTIFILCISVLGCFAVDSYSQSTKLSLHLENVTIKNALREIEDQSEFRFFYSNNVDVERKVSVRIQDKQIDDILNELFGEAKVRFNMIGRQIAIFNAEEEFTSAFSGQQNKTITGKITNLTNEPLPGVTVRLKGTTDGTITDIDGNYILKNVPADATLVFSFVGMKTVEISVGKQTTLNVVMVEESIGLEEVVAIGYGSQKKINLTGSVSSVRVDEQIVARSLVNVSSGLQGLMPGLSISQNTGMAGKNNVEMLIRGQGTVNDASPLIVIDGMPDIDISRLNMNDIESVSVLKDASSSAVYGSRAANGVILITTKSGHQAGAAKLSVSSSYTIETPTSSYRFIPDYARALTLQQAAELTTKLKTNILFKDGTIDQWLALGMIDPLRYPNTDWWDVIMRNGRVFNNNISASGSQEKSNFFVSVGIIDQKGMQINNDYKRYNARFNYDYKIRHNISIGTRFSGNWSKWIYSLDDGFTSSVDASNLHHAPAGITPYDPKTGHYGGEMAYNESPTAYNPYFFYTNDLTHQNRQEVNPGIYLDWTPVKGLKARVDYTLNYYNQFTWKAGMPAQAYNFQTGSYSSRVLIGENEPIINQTSTGYKTQMSGRLTYDVTFARNHRVNALFVYSEEYWYDRYQMSRRFDRLHPSLHEIDAALPDIQSTAGNSSSEGLISYVGRLNYTAHEKYLFEANFRYDGSSRFSSGSRFGFFPSASLGWRFSEENFVKPFTDKFLSGGKIRLSYGGLGNNSGVNRFQQRETLLKINYMYNEKVVKGLSNAKMINRNLSWETTNVMNIGLDLGFLSNRLTAEIDYYDRLTTGMDRPSDLSIFLSGGYEAPRKNIGDLRNRGFEGNFNYKDRFNKLTYSVNFNVSHNRSRLEKWNEYLGRGKVFINMPYGFVYTYQDKGIAQTWEDVYRTVPQNAAPGDILRVDVNGDGLLDNNDRVAYPRYSQNRPTTHFGLSINGGWKGFDLNILFNGTAGRKDFWLTDFNDTAVGQARESISYEQITETWSWENRNASWPRVGGSLNGENTTFWLDNMNYIRLKNLQLGYTLPRNLLSKFGFGSVRIFGNGENLITITKFRGLDPEKQGNPNDAYPLVKSFTFGIHVNI